MLITFEGIDFSGKTTQVEMLVDYLREKGCYVYSGKQPGSVAFKKELAQIMKHYHLDARAELLLYMADRMQHIDQHILPALNRGQIVILDRYIDSTIAYQGYGRGLDPFMIMTLHKLLIQNNKLFPDITFLLDISLDEFSKRRAKKQNLDRVENKSMNFFDSVVKGYDYISFSNPDTIVHLYGMGDKEIIHRNIVSILESRFPKLKKVKQEVYDE